MPEEPEAHYILTHDPNREPDAEYEVGQELTVTMDPLIREAPRLKAEGEVIRIEERDDGKADVYITFTDHELQGREGGEESRPSWRWLNSDTLVLDEGRRPIILTASGNELRTCGDDGLLKPLSTDEELMRLLRAAPDLREMVEELIQFIEPGPDEEIPDRIPKVVMEAQLLLQRIKEGEA